jgi:DeoR family transcriptional regulator, catabolite repression regulator
MIMKVKDVMISVDKFPVIPENLFFKEALDIMNEKKIGIVCIVDLENNLKGILTDGDIRRKLLKAQKPLSALFADDCIDHAITTPIYANPDTSLKDAVELMELKQIWDLPVLDLDGRLQGLLHLHPVVKYLLNTNL